jgi:ABC-2 type transport system ATP-binding protein
MDNNLMIETRELTKTFGDFVAVDGIGLKISEGSIHGFVGPNGAGKTTTIKMLVGAIRSTKGTGFIKGYPIGSVAAREVIGYSPEHPSFYGNMTALDYLIYMARVSGVERDVARKAAELLDWIELGRFVDTKVGGFSAGVKHPAASCGASRLLKQM